MKQIGTILGTVLFVVAATVMFLAEVTYCYRWWGTSGIFLGIVTGPIFIVAFPFILYFKEGFSLLYFGAWAAGLFGIFITWTSRSDS